MTQAQQLDPYKAFNQALKMFIRSLIQAYPDFSEFKLFHTAYKMIKTVSKKQPCKIFTRMTEGCQEKILAKDEPYFFATTLDVPDSMLSRVYVNSGQKWREFDQETKDAIWAHLTVLVSLARKINGSVDSCS
jgi:hypothetical protein